MLRDLMVFWKQLDQVRIATSAGDMAAATGLLAEMSRTCLTGDAVLDKTRLDLLVQVSQTHGLAYDPPLISAQAGFEAGSETGPESETDTPTPDRVLAPISTTGKPGVSLVTSCMNREANLVRALHSWIACPEITEIVIVDWSSDQPVRDTLRAAGIDDARIIVVRVEDEPRWILSYAFNVGFRVATCERVLKADADIVLDPEFFAKNRLDPGQFIAGNWRKAAEEQAHVNGFFYLFKRDLAAIAGFNEHITTYGWDDDDIYARLEAHGAARRDVDLETIYHLPHSDAERTGAQDLGPDLGHEESDPDPESAQVSAQISALAEIRGDTMYQIRRNRYLAHVMPYWQHDKTLLPFRVHQISGRDLTLSREGWVPHPVPTQISADADYYATLEIASWRLGRQVLGLDRPRLNRLLTTPFADLATIDVAVALGNAPEAAAGARGYLVIVLTQDTTPKEAGDGAGDGNGGPREAAPARAFDILHALARAQGLAPVLSGPFADLPDGAPYLARSCPFVPSWDSLGRLETIAPDQLLAPLERQAGQHFQLNFDPAAIAALEVMEIPAPVLAPISAPAPVPTPAPIPALSLARPRIFIDAQHGLGNRLRAIGSAAAIAEKTDRELVVIWQPDDHCDCQLGDLFDYDGAVIEESFTARAANQGCAVYNYMEIEPGARKDAEIPAATTGDIYARSAYVLNSPLSSWTDENRFLRGLRPVAAVRDLVAGVRSPNDLSAHIRMEAGAGLDHNTYDNAENWTQEGHALLHEWRAKSHFSHFLTRIDALIAAGEVQTLFIATDLPDTYATFQERYGDRLAWLERALYDRSKEQLHYALADVILLGRAPRLLGSTWSSFSELAMRLAPRDMTVEMSGTDF